MNNQQECCSTPCGSRAPELAEGLEALSPAALQLLTAISLPSPAQAAEKVEADSAPSKKSTEFWCFGEWAFVQDLILLLFVWGWGTTSVFLLTQTQPVLRSVTILKETGICPPQIRPPFLKLSLLN